MRIVLHENSREYYALTQIPEEFFRIFVENLQNYIVNHMKKLPDLTLKEVFGTDKLKELVYYDCLRPYDDYITVHPGAPTIPI